MDLVEEEDLAFAEIGEDGGEVALDLEGGAGGLLEADVELVGDDGGESGFAEAGGTGEEDVVEGFAAGFGGFEGDGELLFGFGLADEFLEAAGAERLTKNAGLNRLSWNLRGDNGTPVPAGKYEVMLIGADTIMKRTLTVQ